MDCIPADTIRGFLLPFLSLRDIVRLDSAAVRHDLRVHISCALHGYAVPVEKSVSIVEAAAEWFRLKSCYPDKVAVTGEAYQLPSIACAKAIHFRGFPSDGTALQHATRRISKAKQVSFIDCAVAGFADILQALLIRGENGLQLLNVDNVEAFNSGHFLALFPHLVRLKTLVLKKAAALDTASVTLLSSTVSTHLQHLYVIGAQNPVWTDSVLTALSARCRNLRTVHIDRCANITTEGVAKLAANCSRLTSLDLKNEGELPVVLRVTEGAFRALAEHCPDLAHLLITHHHIDDAALLHLAQGCRKLRYLHLMGHTITDIGLADLARNCSAMQVLMIGGIMRFTDAGVEAVARGCTALRHQVFSGVGEYSAQSLAILGAHCRSLEYLRWNAFRADIPAQCFAALGQGCPALRSVSFSFCHFLTDDAIAALVDNCPNLQELYLSECTRLSYIAVLVLLERAHALQKLVVGRILPATKATFAAARPDVVVL